MLRMLYLLSLRLEYVMRRFASLSKYDEYLVSVSSTVDEYKVVIDFDHVRARCQCSSREYFWKTRYEK